MPAKEFSCQSAGVDCDFMVRSENDDELMEVVKEHVKEAHDMDLSDSDVRDAAKTV
ncbi:DUF1059 domain-containing protein [Haloarculaceae archaeon H-GB2-1]|nr:DUF1059 domain-containing protein [Haloarculaceae archaeon H-GB1-1]MEA5386437.1 DUF1059 domain-containing protein [Haloarculaceae archaeon H-GB11]MEA5407950.1 DUF1059 domain-containing protein [Haloarculaceae archaeon H-GB2-1]